jgi:HEPN domain-containing protein
MNGVELVKEWFQHARNDLIVAKHALEDLYPRQVEISCFHCQQAAEKSLKAYLLSCGIEPPRVHNLRLLCQICMRQDASFETMLAPCSDLTPYGVEARYPNELEIDEQNAKTALMKAGEIYSFCFAKIQCEDEMPNDTNTGNTKEDVL